MAQVATPGPTVLDALSLLAEVGDHLLVRTVRDTHLALLDRTPAGTIHRGITSALYGGLTGGLTMASRGLDRVAATGVGPRLETDARGRFVSSAVNGLIGDRLLRERPQLAIPMAVRRHGADVAPEREALDEAFPEATGRLVVFLHGLCENEAYWNRHRDRTGTTYAEMLAERGWTPLMLRANTGLPLRENGAALTALLQRVVEAWPVPVTRIALVGHSLGGLVIRAAGAVASRRRGAVEPARHRRGHAGDAAPRCADRVGHRPRQPGTVEGEGDGRLRPGPRLAFPGRARPGGRARRGRATAAARPLPPGRGHADQQRAAPGGPRRRRPAGPAAVGVRTGPAAHALPGAPTCCTSAGPTTSGCSTTPTCTPR